LKFKIAEWLYLAHVIFYCDSCTFMLWIWNMVVKAIPTTLCLQRIDVFKVSVSAGCKFVRVGGLRDYKRDKRTIKNENIRQEIEG